MACSASLWAKWNFIIAAALVIEQLEYSLLREFSENGEEQLLPYIQEPPPAERQSEDGTTLAMPMSE